MACVERIAEKFSLMSDEVTTFKSLSKEDLVLAEVSTGLQKNNSTIDDLKN